MKKYRWLLLSFMMIAIIGVGFASCNDDDDEDSKVLVGQWQECESDGVLRDDAKDYEVAHLVLRSDGTGDYWSMTKGKKDRGACSFDYSYTLKGTSGRFTMTLTATDGYYDEDEIGETESVGFTLIDGIFLLGEIYYKKVSSAN